MLKPVGVACEQAERRCCRGGSVRARVVDQLERRAAGVEHFDAKGAKSVTFIASLPRQALVVRAPWFGVFVMRLRRFAEETRDVTSFIAKVPAGVRVRPIVFERSSTSFQGVHALLHFSGYYAASRPCR